MCDSSTEAGPVSALEEPPLLNVPICTDCLATYESGDYLLSEEDGHRFTAAGAATAATSSRATRKSAASARRASSATWG